MRQTLQVIWLHIWKKWKSLGEKLGSDIELKNSILISGEAGTLAYKKFFFLKKAPQAQNSQDMPIKGKEWVKNLDVQPFRYRSHYSSKEALRS